ncbi:Uncharacterised protein [Leminorella richardii]|uniref:Uncharacterized protein n=1 Tax=Leminorella richardii TaxID=158841 RepID=A0A2X4V356_9GAMM|nr:hypothetical protein [Leminorella richardii]SQI42588.1 Uncharacterised protein [Leminorella richardii]
MKRKLLTLFTAAMICSTVQAQPQELNDAERTESLLQLGRFQMAIEKKDIRQLSTFIDSEVYQRDHLSWGEKGPEICSDETTKLTDADIVACGDNIVYRLQALSHIKPNAGAMRVDTYKIENKESACVTTFSGSFSAEALGDRAPGLLLRIEVDSMDNATDEQIDGCVGLDNYFFTFKDQKLTLTSIQSYP